MAERIRGDRIDVPIDLAGHTAGNRLGAFALRPAPIQATWIGWAPTGLSAIEWFIADQHTWPGTGADEPTILKLPDSLVCYGPPAYAPAVAPLPASANGYLTFGCFNNLAKVTPQTLAAWAAILAAVPNSRIVLKAGPFRDASTREYFHGAFAGDGVDPRIGDHRSDVGRALGLAVLPSDRGEPLLIQVADGSELDVVEDDEVPRDVRTPIAEPDQRDTDTRGHASGLTSVGTAGVR